MELFTVKISCKLLEENEIKRCFMLNNNIWYLVCVTSSIVSSTWKIIERREIVSMKFLYRLLCFLPFEYWCWLLLLLQFSFCSALLRLLYSYIESRAVYAIATNVMVRACGERTTMDRNCIQMFSVYQVYVQFIVILSSENIYASVQLVFFVFVCDTPYAVRLRIVNDHDR